MKLSIITVNLNNLEGLKKTYESVVCQTFTDYEWLVIDGGSTDGSREFIEEHNDKFAYWCSEPDKGIYNAMNKGIVRAKGEYLNFMNSGDCFACEETLTGVFGKLRTADILYGYVTENVNGRCNPSRLMKKNVYWYDLYYYTFPHQGTFINRKMFSIVGLYEEECRIVADWKWFIIAILNHEASYEFIPDKIAVIQEGGISSTSACELERQQQRKKIFPRYITEDDALNLTILSIIQSTQLTRFLFKIVKVISIQISSFRKKRAMIRLTPQ
ncbi:MAG: glycosyltransferase family 2 protein [Prevotella sp.]